MRQLRIQFKNAFYHVFARGQRKDVIFQDQEDRNTFLNKLEEMTGKHLVIIHCFVLMDNHYHLVIQTPGANLSRAMHQLNTSYCNWFKAKYRIVGTILQGRYKALVINDEEYLLNLSFYIHSNPVREGIVSKPEDFVWSSYKYYLNSKEVPAWLETVPILKEFSMNPAAYQMAVEEWISEGKDLLFQEELHQKKVILGNDEFKDIILAKSKSLLRCYDSHDLSDSNAIKKIMVEKIKKIIMEKFNSTEKEIKACRRNNLYRKLYIYGLKHYSYLTIREISGIMKMDCNAVRKMALRFEHEATSNNNTRELIAFLESAIVQ